VPAVFDDRYLPGIRRLTAALHAEGAKTACQLIVSYHVAFGGGPAEHVGPSPVLNQMLRETPRALEVDEIRWIVEECPPGPRGRF